MKTLHASLTSAYGAAVQMPAWLVEITLGSIYRYCSHRQTTWDSQTWLKMDVDVGGLSVGAMSVNGSLVFGNADDAFGALALTEGFADKRIRIWGFDATVADPLPADLPVLVCDAVGGGVDIGYDKVRVQLRDSTEYLIAPRAIVAPEFGFTQLLPAGRTLTINGISFVIQRGR